VLRVLTYHRIAELGAGAYLDPALVSATPDVFRKQMLHLKRWYRPVSLGDVLSAFRDGGALPPRAVHVTVDDAYGDFSETAWPILRELDIPVTLFVATAYPDDPSRSFWWDRLHRLQLTAGDDSWKSAMWAQATAQLGGQAGEADLRGSLRRLPHDETERLVDIACHAAGLTGDTPQEASTVLSWDQLRNLHQQGVTIGAHTRDHVALSHVDPLRARSEIRQSLDDLTRELGHGPWAFAYPYGIYDPEVADIAEEEGCALGFTCDDGLNDPNETDPMRLRRTNITLRTSPPVFALRMLPWVAGIDRWRHRHERSRVS